MIIHLVPMLPTGSSDLPVPSSRSLLNRFPQYIERAVLLLHYGENGTYLVLLQVGFTLPLLSPKARCALTVTFSPLPNTEVFGGIFSAALSLKISSQIFSLAINQHLVCMEPGLSSRCNATDDHPARLLWCIVRIYFNMSKIIWRPGPESNRRTRICNPLHNHSATRPWGKM